MQAVEESETELPRDAKLSIERGGHPREARLWQVFGVAQMSDVSSLTELARFVGRSGVELESANARGLAVNDISWRASPKPGKQKVSDLLSIVLSLSARTRRMVLPKVEIDLDVFSPGGHRALRIKLPV